MDAVEVIECLGTLQSHKLHVCSKARYPLPPPLSPHGLGKRQCPTLRIFWQSSKVFRTAATEVT